MASKRTAASKRSKLLLASDYTKSFAKDWHRLSESGRYDMVRLKAVMMQLVAGDEPLGPEWKDHPLKGEWADHRECHVGGDFLLIYRVSETAIVFVRAGTHSELFG
ncbi:MAG: type II toxin-antitoxin system YafQ family toxin [Nitrospirae bacterium]|nr:MAG: type II toxin-antitoxin system YafQ family toxin [Nitrospirota bacterium]